MALNPSSQSNTAVEVIDGTVSEFYNVVDQCIRRSEVMPGQYKSITSPSYSNNCPIYESSFTTIDIGCPAPQIVDINNSFITAEFEVPITFDAGIASMNNINTFFVGWRSSLDALHQYNIYCNHKLVLQQIYVGEESFILQSLIPEHVRCRRPNQYTTYENASSFSPDVCGTYITLNSDEGTEGDPTALDAITVNVKIPIKLDINQFLLFQNFKYLAGFEGTWSIRLYPTTKNLIVCPVDPKYTVPRDKLDLLTTLKSGQTATIDSFHHHFVQIGDKVKCLKVVKFKLPTWSVSGNAATITYNSEITSGDITVSAGTCKLNRVLYHQTQFELMYDIYDGLKARYMQRPLTIPVNTLVYGRFAGIIHPSQTSSTYTTPASNVESMFILPFHDDLHHTVCFNPNFKNLYLSISGFGNFPQQPFNTGDDDEDHIRFVNMTLDALNINNSPIMAPNKDLLNSLEYRKTKFWTNADTSIHPLAAGETINIRSNDDRHDKSNFLIGIPFSNDIDFQGGLTSNGNINLKLSAGNSIINEIGQTLNGKDCEIGATCMFCTDAALMIKVVPYADQPECRLVDERIV